MLYIRADGSKEIGMGHVMRCLSVAEAVADIDPVYPPVFITADAGCRAMIEERGFRVIVLGTDYRDMMGELPLLREVLLGGPCSAGAMLLVDSYQVSREYYLALRSFVRVACFEDMGEAYPVDLLINYNIYAPALESRYQERDPQSCIEDRYPQRVLLGTEYMPLRKAFQGAAEYVVQDKVTNVIITTGGSDPFFAAGAFADVLCDDEMIVEQGIHLHVISGPFNRFADELKRRYQCGEMMQWHDHTIAHSGGSKVPITIHESVKDMRSLVLQSDVVITATGSTIYEVSALWGPMIVFYFAENQRQGAEALGALTDIVNAGCFAAEHDAVADRVKEALKRCIMDNDYRQLLHRQEKGLVDGKGAHRIAERLTKLYREQAR